VQCATVAAGVLIDRELPIVSGQAILIGTPQAHKGDCVYIKVPDTEINGIIIEGNMIVHRVQHGFDGSNFRTTTDLERIMHNAYDYLGRLNKTCQVVKKNQCRG
jgi:hypothetical protein